MALIPEHIIQQVLDASPIVDVVESYFPLKRAGSAYKALCPFHTENTPSFNVNPQRNTWHCFGCSEGGSPIKFVQKYENLSFPDAVRKLAKKAGIPMDEAIHDPEAEARGRAKKKLIALHKDATEWFHHMLLKDPSARHARAYLKDRGFDSTIAAEWQMGYAPNSGDQLIHWAKEKGYNEALLITAGLAAWRDEHNPGRGVYARFRDRVMFPICNDYGDVIAFSGRLLDVNAKAAKYVNSPETPIFSKSKTFFGLHKSKRAILREQRAIVCEGQIDLIMAYQNGVENVTAPLGTAFTSDHARMIQRHVTEVGDVVLCFDSDAAGFKAAERSFGELVKAGVFVKVAIMPEGKDPDELIREQGADAFKEVIEAAPDFVDFQIEFKSRTMDFSNMRDRVRFANEMAETLGMIPNKIAQDAAINKVVTLLGVSPDEYRVQVGNAAKRAHFSKGRSASNFKRPEHDQENAPDSPQQAPFTVANTHLRQLYRAALTSIEARTWLAAQKNFFESDSEAALLLKIIDANLDISTPSATTAFIATLPDGEESFLSQILNEQSPVQTAGDAQTAVLRIKIEAIDRVIRMRQGQMKSGISNDEISGLTAEIMRLQQESFDLNQQLANIAAPPLEQTSRTKNTVIFPTPQHYGSQAKSRFTRRIFSAGKFNCSRH